MKQHQLYRAYGENGLLLYVGVSVNAINRASQHNKLSNWFKDIKKLDIESFNSRSELMQAERKAVAKEQPLHNIRLKKTSIEQIEAEEARWKKEHEEAYSKGFKEGTEFREADSKGRDGWRGDLDCNYADFGEDYEKTPKREIEHAESLSFSYLAGWENAIGKYSSETYQNGQDWSGYDG